jgi:hypothetical protein
VFFCTSSTPKLGFTSIRPKVKMSIEITVGFEVWVEAQVWIGADRSAWIWFKCHYYFHLLATPSPVPKTLLQSLPTFLSFGIFIFRANSGVPKLRRRLPISRPELLMGWDKPIPLGALFLLRFFLSITYERIEQITVKISCRRLLVFYKNYLVWKNI